MMYERLIIARDLLKDDGVIFISIDDNENHNLRKICDEIFGESNFLADIIWEGNGKNDSRFVSIAHENILLYARNKTYLEDKDITFRAVKDGINEIFDKVAELISAKQNNYNQATEELKKWYQSLDKNHPSWQHRHYSNIDNRGVYFAGDISAESGRGRKPYEVKHPITGKNCKAPERGWPTEATMKEWMSKNLVDFGPDETYVPKRKRYLSDTLNYVISSVIYKDSRKAYKEMIEMFGAKIFDNPKDISVLKKYVEITTQKNDLVLDFFSGSSTTAHAVMELNVEDDGNRKFIMAQIPELTAEDSEAFKAGYKTIAEIGKERIRRAGKKIREENKEKLSERTTPLDTGFRVYKTDTTNMKDVFYHPAEVKQGSLLGMASNVKDDRTAEDLLTQVILGLGLELSLPIEKKEMRGQSVFFVAGNALVACFDDHINLDLIDDLAKISPLKVVFKDASFKNDSDRMNVETRMKRLSPETEIKVL
jgi:adenine-specific DNA-methyltransferase